MTMLTHISDIHFDHCTMPKILKFCDLINATNTDYLAITGDISTAKYLISHLSILATSLKCKIFFNLGNHDRWNASFAYINNEMAKLNFSNLTYLDTNEPITINETTAIVGDSGWYDLLQGTVDRSYWFPNGFPDFKYIADFAGLSGFFKKKLCLELTQQSCDRLEAKLKKALETHNTVYVCTHVPPFREASWHEGKICNDESAPFFTNKIIGEMLLRVIKENTNKQCIVLTGHSHSAALYQPLDNLIVHTAASEYGEPSVYKTFYI